MCLSPHLGGPFPKRLEDRGGICNLHILHFFFAYFDFGPSCIFVIFFEWNYYIYTKLALMLNICISLFEFKFKISIFKKNDNPYAKLCSKNFTAIFFCNLKKVFKYKRYYNDNLYEFKPLPHAFKYLFILLTC